jgi:Ion channel
MSTQKAMIGFSMRRLERAFETGRILPFLVVSIAGLACASGVLMWLLDHKEYPTLGRALWWAAQTVTTVGYGDVTPAEPVGRLVASGLMIVGYASLSLLTGIVASLLVSRRTAAEASAALVRVEDRLSEIERRLRREPAGD